MPPRKARRGRPRPRPRLRAEDRQFFKQRGIPLTPEVEAGMRQLQDEYQRTLIQLGFDENDARRALAEQREQLLSHHGFAAQELNEAAARRGVFNSGIRLGQQQELQTEAGQQMSGLANEFGRQQRSISNARAEALERMRQGRQQLAMDATQQSVLSAIQQAQAAGVGLSGLPGRYPIPRGIGAGGWGRGGRSRGGRTVYGWGRWPRIAGPLPEIFYGGNRLNRNPRVDPSHMRHLHAAFPRSRAAVRVGRHLQRLGFRVGEHPAFGGVGRGHVSRSFHYRPGGQALDINYDPRPGGRWRSESAALNWLEHQLTRLYRQGRRLPGRPAPGGYGRWGQLIPASRGVRPIVARAARRYGLHPALIAAVGHYESGWRNNLTSSAGARGYMQVMPFHAPGRNLMNPRFNIMLGSRILRDYIRRMGGNIYRGLAAYNAGPGRWRIPAAQRYARNVLGLYRRYR